MIGAAIFSEITARPSYRSLTDSTATETISHDFRTDSPVVAGVPPLGSSAGPLAQLLTPAGLGDRRDGELPASCTRHHASSRPTAAATDHGNGLLRIACRRSRLAWPSLSGTCGAVLAILTHSRAGEDPQPARNSLAAQPNRSVSCRSHESGSRSQILIEMTSMVRGRYVSFVACSVWGQGRARDRVGQGRRSRTVRSSLRAAEVSYLGNYPLPGSVVAAGYR